MSLWLYRSLAYWPSCTSGPSLPCSLTERVLVSPPLERYASTVAYVGSVTRRYNHHLLDDPYRLPTNFPYVPLIPPITAYVLQS